MPVSVDISTCTVSRVCSFSKIYVHICFRRIGNGSKASASESLHSNVATANALYTEFKPAAYNVKYLKINEWCIRYEKSTLVQLSWAGHCGDDEERSEENTCKAT